MTSKDLEADYTASKFGQKLGFGTRPVLLIVDFVMAYLEPTSPLYAGVEKERESCARILAAARENHIPVIFTNVVYHNNGADGGVFYKKVGALKALDEGSPLGDFPEELEPLQEELVVTKQYPSAFFGTPLASILTSMSIDTVVITGLTTSGCVRASTLDAMQYGFIPIVVADACGDRDERPQQSNLFDLQAKYADVVDEAAVIDYFRGLDEHSDG